MREFDREKYKNLMHRVIWNTQDREGWGSVELFKALWFFEARRFALANERFSNAVYVRDEYGPRPKLAYPLLSELETEGRIKRFKLPYHNRTLDRAKALMPPPSGLLNADQARELKYWIDYIGGVSANEIGEESHDYGWEIAEQGEELPLNAILASRMRDPQGDELEWALDVVRKYNLN